jgi:hypothetical protein
VRSRALVVGLGVFFASLALPTRAAEEPLVRPLGPAEVDWARGLVRVKAGAAADLRMPGPDSARADAHRRATQRARALLSEALADLPLGPGRKLSKATIETAIDRARTGPVEHQSNGGVLLELELGFSDLGPAPAGAPKTAPRAGEEPASGLTIAVSNMPLEAMPTLLLRKQEVTVTAVYRVGEPPKSAGAVRGRRDRAGRLLLPASAPSPSDQPVVIYVRSIARRER